MKKIISLTLIYLISILSLFSYKSQNEKTYKLQMLDMYSQLIKSDLYEEGEVGYLTKIMLKEDEVSYEIIEYKKNENIKFSLKSNYFSYLKNKLLEVEKNYFVSFK